MTDQLKPARLVTVATGLNQGARIVADYGDDETQIAIVRPPTELYQDDGGIAVCAWAQRHVRLFLAAPALLALVQSVEWVLTDVSLDIYECPWCGSYKCNGHADDCDREAALAMVEGDA